MSTVDPPRDFVYDPFSQKAMSDPLPLYRVLRDEHPMYYSAEYDTYFLSRFEDAHAMLSSTDNTFISSEGTLPPPEVLRRHNRGAVQEATTTPLSPHFMHGSPAYERLRQAHGKPLRPGAVRRLEEDIRRLARERLDILVPRGRFDLTQNYAGIVASSVMCRMFGIPLQEAKYVLDMVNAGSLVDPETGGVRSTEPTIRLFETVMARVRDRRRAGHDGADGDDGALPLIDGMIEAEIDDRRLDDAEIAMTLMSVLVGGVETVPKIVAHGLWLLQQHPQQMRKVREDLTANVPVAFREMVRLGGPAQWFLRTVHRPTTLRGHELEVGRRVAYIVASAARDEREYGDDADEFRWDRPNKRLLNFGHGQHFCIGYHLALMEGSVLVEEFLRRVPEFTVVEEQAVRLPSSFQWGWNELPITVPVEA